MMKARARMLSALAVGALIALPLAGCGKPSPEEAASGSSRAATSDGGGSSVPASDGGGATQDPAQVAKETPQQRVTAYVEAADAAAAGGWKDLSYLDDYLTPELSAQVRTGEEKNAATGAVMEGHTVLSDFRLVEQTETKATIEFCEDLSGLTATKDGKPFPVGNASDVPSVAQYVLVRDAATSPWMISVKGYYPEGTTCQQHFGG